MTRWLSARKGTRADVEGVALAAGPRRPRRDRGGALSLSPGRTAPDSVTRAKCDIERLFLSFHTRGSFLVLFDNCIILWRHL